MAILRISTRRSDDKKRKANSTSNSNCLQRELSSTSGTSNIIRRGASLKFTLPLKGYIFLLLLLVVVQGCAFLQQPQPQLLAPNRSSFRFTWSSHVTTSSIRATGTISHFHAKTNFNCNGNREEMRKLGLGFGLGRGSQLVQNQIIGQRLESSKSSLAVITALAAVKKTVSNNHSSTCSGDCDSSANSATMGVSVGASRSATNSRDVHFHRRNKSTISRRGSARNNPKGIYTSSSALHATSSEDLKSNNERERRRRSKKNKKKRLFKRSNSSKRHNKNNGIGSSNDEDSSWNNDNITNSAERLSRAVAKASAERRREEQGEKGGIDFSFYDNSNYYDNDDNSNSDSEYDYNIGNGRNRRMNDHDSSYYEHDNFSSTPLASSSNVYEYEHEYPNEIDPDDYTDQFLSQTTNEFHQNRGNNKAKTRSSQNSNSKDNRNNPHRSGNSKDNGHDNTNKFTNTSRSISSFSSSPSQPRTPPSSSRPPSSVASLTQLTQIIDSQLYANGPRGSARGDYPPLNGVVQNARDNMISLLGFNQVAGDWKSHSVRSPQSTYNVAIVFGKDLVRDQITVEYASRIRALGRLFKEDEDFRPSLVCFCGGIADGNHVSNADAGYIFFRHMCEAQNIDLGDSNIGYDNGDGSSADSSVPPVGIFIDNASRDDDDIVYCVTEKVKNDYIPIWLESTPTVDGLNQKVVDVHFTLISTEYHLCNINDVHHRSPQQSLLTAVEVLGDSFKGVGGVSGRQNQNNYMSKKMSSRKSSSSSSGLHHFYEDDYDLYRYGYPNANTDSHNNNMRQKSPARGAVKTSWSFQYATYPYIYAKDEATVFLGKCYLLGEELMPLLINMRGVVEQREFFQRDNYLMLTSIRRSLVNHIEELHKSAPSIKTALIRSSQNPFDENNKYEGGRDIVTILEGALLSLGRCVDLIKPAGLHIGSVSKSEWKRALDSLEHSMSEIRDHCDPDRPLRPSEWGKLIDEEKGTLQI